MSSTVQFLKMATERASKLLRAFVSSVGQAFSRWNRWARLTAVVLATLLLSLVVLNVALNLGVSRPFLARLISVSPKSFALDYRRAWSFWPTLVHVRDFSVRGSDVNLQWQIDIDKARVSIDLLALFKREFHATGVRAQGIGFRLRQKLDPNAATGDRMAVLPPIAGFEGPPLREAGPPAPGISDENYDLWSVRIEDVDGRGRQVWVDEFHFEGDLRVTGAFYLRPKRQLWVGPANATIFSGTVVLGNDKLLDHTSGSADCTIPPFDPLPPVGMEVFRFISGNVRLDADIPSARALDYYTRIRGNSTLFDGGKGVFHLDGALRAGVVRPLDLSLAMRELTVTKAAWRVLGSLEVSTKTEATGPSAWLLRIAPVELRRAEAKSAAIHGKELRIRASTAELDISKPAPDFEIHGDLPSAQVPNLQIVNSLLASKGGLHVDAGKAALTAHFDANTGANRAKGDLAVDADGLSAHDGDLHFGGRLNISAHVAKVLLDSGDLDLSKAVIDARDVTVRDSNAAVFNWWSSIEVHDAKLRPGQRVPLDVPFTAKLENATPILAFSKRTPSMPDWITRFLAGGEAQASGRLRAGKAFVELSNLKAKTGILRVEGDFRERGEAKSGVFRVSAGPLSVGIELKNEETKLIFIGRPVEPLLEAPAK